jgi:hypothetical protein
VLAVLHEDLLDLPFRFGLDLVHQLHRLDDADDLALAHGRADLDERRRLRRRTVTAPPRRTRTWPLPSASTSDRSNSAAIRASSRTDSKSMPAPPLPPFLAGAGGTTLREDFAF